MWKNKSKEYIREYQKEYYKNNKDKFKEYHKKYGTKNKEYLAGKMKEYYLENKEHLLKVQKERPRNLNKEKILIRNQNFRKNNLERIRIGARARNYNISSEQLKHLHEIQGDVCAICGNPEILRIRKNSKETKSLAIDHNHKTGKIRGLLCGNCNTGIGHLKDDIDLLYKAIEYLKKHQEKEERVYEFTDSCS